MLLFSSVTSENRIPTRLPAIISCKKLGKSIGLPIRCKAANSTEGSKTATQCPISRSSTVRKTPRKIASSSIPAPSPMTQTAALNKAANCSWENSATSQLPGRLSKIRQTIPGIASAITVHSREK